jgi:hypothetical protein
VPAVAPAFPTPARPTPSAASCGPGTGVVVGLVTVGIVTVGGEGRHPRVAIALQAGPGGGAQLVEHAGEDGPLAVAEDLEDLVDRRLAVGAAAGQLGTAGVGDAQHRGAAVVGVVLAGHEATVLERVDHGRDRARHDAQSMCEVAHALRAVGVERGQQCTARKGQPIAAWPCGAVAAAAAEQPADTEEGLGQGFGRGADGFVGEGLGPLVARAVSMVAMPRRMRVAVLVRGVRVLVIRFWSECHCATS